MSEQKGIILSGMRPTGKLHLGHYSVLENWAKLQEQFESYFFIADLHALTTAFDTPELMQENIRGLALDWLSAGIDPEKAAIFVQSQVREHAELHLLFSMITPLSWLERVPTYKDQVNQFKKSGKDITTYGFLGYPLLMASDILLYRSTAVPVGEDQLPHLEFCRELARRFNHLYQTDLFPEPQALLAKIKMLPGIDNRKMSKSYHNDISLAASTEEIKEKVRQMVTDPARIKKTDPGHPEVCTVYTYHTFYNEAEKEEVACSCKAGTIGCVACKKQLAAKLDAFMEPLRERRAQFAAQPKLIDDVLAHGREKAGKAAQATMEQVKTVMGIVAK